ncbi:MAG TPA: sugar transferase [Candidatus Eisenbacteria bacterium]|nr:sugar transferase [Candidatus Eisenbacteria bacterium]
MSVALAAPAAAPAVPVRPHPHTNGNGHPNGNGVANGMGVANGHGVANGVHVNGHANGHANGNGHVNGHATLAHGNGHAQVAWTPAQLAAAAAAGHASALPVFEAPAREGFYLRWGKRAFDLMGATLGLVISAPAVACLAIAIKLESRGPVLYRSTRIGRGGRPFTFYKLRSMVNGADRRRHELVHLNECDGPVFKMARDPRITRVGRFMRVTSLDEIPQLYNVLRGEMTLVGPRPPIPAEVAQYEPWQLRRLDATPGLTCLWQISGRSRIGFQEWMRLDLEYIRGRSLWLDLKILLRTIPAVLSREGAY